MFARPPRLFSNKENSTFPLDSKEASSSAPSASSKTSKPRVHGMGKAPRKFNQHSSKPYTRSASVQRAKAKTTGGEGGKRRPAPIELACASTSSIANGVADQSSPGRIAPGGREVRIPLRLPRPGIPPVEGLKGHLEGVPVDYVLARLRPQLPGLLLVSSLYRPCPVTSGMHDPMPFAVPHFVLKDDSVKGKLSGREPDACLAIKKRGSSGPVRLIPINQLVYASQCSFWPALGSLQSASPQPTEGDDRLATIAEDDEENEEADIEEAGNTSTDSSATLASTSSGMTLVEDASLRLPLIHLDLPSTETFNLLHTALHLPSRPLLPALLDLPKDVGSHEEVTCVLQEKNGPELMDLLGRIHGVWGNCCALGVGDERIWRAMGEAWRAVVGALAGKPGRT